MRLRADDEKITVNAQPEDLDHYLDILEESLISGASLNFHTNLKIFQVFATQCRDLAALSSQTISPDPYLDYYTVDTRVRSLFANVIVFPGPEYRRKEDSIPLLLAWINHS